MTVFGELSPEDLAALRDLAHDVMAAIVQAGLPARLEDGPGPETWAGGARVWIENANDRGGGLYITWDSHPEIEATVRRAVETMELSGPEMSYAAGVLEAMRIALKAILTAAGFAADDPSDLSGAQVIIRLPGRC